MKTTALRVRTTSNAAQTSYWKGEHDLQPYLAILSFA